MSLLPYVLNEFFDGFRRPAFGNIYDQNFGLGLLESDVTRPRRKLLRGPMRSGYVRQWRNINEEESGQSSIVSTQNDFKINLDVSQFKPEELKVNVENGFIVVDAKHEERADDHGFISRQFTRKYKIPEDVDVNALQSNLSSDGVLSLEAPKIKKVEHSGREIPITRTNAPALKGKKAEQSGETMEQ